jgi:[acyl-carrier-protein] S-malonyltransferase
MLSPDPGPARPVAPDPAAHVAVVGGRPISIAQLEARITQLRRGPRGRHLAPAGGSESARLGQWVVHELVTEAVLVHEARAAGIIGAEVGSTRDEDGAASPVLSQMAVARLFEIVTASVTVPRRDVRAYYVRNRDMFWRAASRRVRHVLLPDEGSAQRAARRVAAGEDMAALAETSSIDRGSRALGGDLGEVHRGEFSGPLEDAIFDAAIGAVIGPIATEHGWHVARVEAITSASCVPYRDARQTIEGELLAAERTVAFGAWLERRRTALARIEPEFEHPAHPGHGFPSHRH